MKNKVFEKAQDTLLALGVPADMKGFQYICDAVSILHMDNEDVSMTELYSVIAINRKTSNSRVERTIRHAISEIPDRKFIPYFGEMANRRNGNVLHILAIKVGREVEHE